MRRRASAWGFMELEAHYARLLGRYLSAERLTDPAFGINALLAADVTVEQERRRLEAEMAEVVQHIREHFSPDWQPSLVRPVPPRITNRMLGITSEAYRVLRLFRREMTTRQVAAEVCERLDLDPNLASKLSQTIRNSFIARAKEGLLTYQGRPTRWRVVRRSALAETPDIANTLPKPRTFAGS